MDEQQLQELKARYGELFEITSQASDDGRIPTVTAVFRQPTRQAFQRYTKDVAKDSIRAQQQLMMDSIVYPSMDDIRSTLEKFPGLLFVFTAELIKMIGLNLEAEVKKL